MKMHFFCLIWILLCVELDELNNWFITHPNKDPQIRYIFLNESLRIPETEFANVIELGQ